MITADCNACQHEDNPLCNRCFIPENSKLNKPTNADRIRAMTDEELGHWLYLDASEREDWSLFHWLKWLREEA